MFSPKSGQQWRKKCRLLQRKMPVDPKEQNAELLKLIGANKTRLAHTQKMIRDLQKRASEPSKTRRSGQEKAN
jgi:hypothetical protein